jgi:hypothetical protein
VARFGVLGWHPRGRKPSKDESAALACLRAVISC